MRTMRLTLPAATLTEHEVAEGYSAQSDVSRAPVSKSSTVPERVRVVETTEPTEAPGTRGGAGGCGAAMMNTCRRRRARGREARKVKATHRHSGSRAGGEHTSASTNERLWPGRTTVTKDPEAGEVPVASEAHLKAKWPCVGAVRLTAARSECSPHGVEVAVPKSATESPTQTWSGESAVSHARPG